MKKHHFILEAPYGVAKVYAHWITVNYREAYNIYACNGILFNHESPFRGENFVTRKITRAYQESIKLDLQDRLYIGNLMLKETGDMQKTIEMQWLMLQQDKPDDYVISTGKQYTVKEFIMAVAKQLDIEINWSGFGRNEKGLNKNNKVIVEVDPRYFRPTEVDELLGGLKSAC